MKENTVEKTLKCCICGCEIKNGIGHNPFPVMDEGSCCDICDNILVIPARIRALAQAR